MAAGDRAARLFLGGVNTGAGIYAAGQSHRLRSRLVEAQMQQMEEQGARADVRLGLEHQRLDLSREAGERQSQLLQSQLETAGVSRRATEEQIKTSQQKRDLTEEAAEKTRVRSLLVEGARLLSALEETPEADKSMVYQSLLSQYEKAGGDISNMPPQYQPGMETFYKAQIQDVSDLLDANEAEVVKSGEVPAEEYAKMTAAEKAALHGYVPGEADPEKIKKSEVTPDIYNSWTDEQKLRFHSIEEPEKLERKTEFRNVRAPNGDLVTGLFDKQSGDKIAEVGRGPVTQTIKEPDKLLTPAEAQMLGQPIGTTVGDVFGVTPKPKAELAAEKKTATMQAEEKQDFVASAEQLDQIAGRFDELAQRFATPMGRQILGFEVSPTLAGGPKAKLEQMLSVIGAYLPGGLGEAITFTDTESIFNAVETFNKTLETALVNNPKFPVAEVARVRALLPSAAGLTRNPQLEFEKFQQLARELRDRAHINRLQAAGESWSPRLGSYSNPHKPQGKADMGQVQFGDFFINPANDERLQRG